MQDPETRREVMVDVLDGVEVADPCLGVTV